MSGFSYVQTPEGFATLTILIDGELHTVTSNSSNFYEVFNRVRVDDYDVVGLINASVGLATDLIDYGLSDKIRVENGHVLYNDKVVNNTCADYIVDLYQSGSKDYVAFANFMAKIVENEQHHAKNRLFDWLEATGGFALTPEGNIIGYKGLLDNFTSIHAGPGRVNGVSYGSANLDNSPGNTVEVDRVEMNPEVGCSYGLHAGTWDYASGFSRGKTVSVIIDPRDVVSVPTDCSDQKMRCKKYVVKEQVTAPYSAKVVK